MRFTLALIILFFPIFSYSETIATCFPKTGHAYCADIGIVNKTNSSWQILPANGTISLSKLSENDFGILFTDATKEVQSSKEEGAEIKLLRNKNNELTFLVNDTANDAIEIYDFLQDRNGHNIMTITTNEGGDASFYKSSVEMGDCSYIKFDKRK